jgi:phage FluMu protein Com
MRLGKATWRKRREELRRDEGPIPTAPSGRPYHQVRCFKCGRLLALVDRMALSGAGAISIQCPRCRQLNYSE